MGALARLTSGLATARGLLAEFYAGRYRGTIARARRDQDDLFMPS